MRATTPQFSPDPACGALNPDKTPVMSTNFAQPWGLGERNYPREWHPAPVTEIRDHSA
ncbi:unnamed protein product [marine sediment metagenome]|uniref:Uncharacterized protein n=1 Tax=marine sediment metagenome TaxID=412755 RepID=X0UG75_9ZZZZ